MYEMLRMLTCDVADNFATYMLKAHLSLSSMRPLEVTERAQRNSRKSMVPSALASNVLKVMSELAYEQREEEEEKNILKEEIYFRLFIT